MELSYTQLKKFCSGKRQLCIRNGHCFLVHEEGRAFRFLPKRREDLINLPLFLASMPTKAIDQSESAKEPKVLSIESSV